MSYADYEDVVKRYPIIKTWGKTETEVNSDLIYFSEIHLNGMLASHFSVPFSGSPPTIQDLTIDLAYYKALVFRDKKQADKIIDVVNGRIQNLKDGKEYIYTGSGTTIMPSNASNEVWSNTKDYYPVHGMIDIHLEDVDPDRISAEESERS